MTSSKGGLSRVAEGVWRVRLGFVNAFLVVDDSGLTVVDAGPPKRAGKLLEAVVDAGFKPTQIQAVAVTHYHPDHIGGLSRLSDAAPQARIWAPEKDVEVVRGQRPQPGPTATGQLARLGATLGRRIIGQAPPARVDDVVGAETPTPEGLGLRVVPTPGHTAGHTSYLLERAGVLFVGDAATNLGKLGPPPKTFTEDMPLALKSLGALAELDFDVACFGHGTTISHEASAAFRSYAATLDRP